MSVRFLMLGAMLVLGFATLTPGAEPPIRALLLTGHNNHNWAFTSRVHKETLESTGLFLVDIAEDPELALSNAEALKKYRLFVIDFNDSHDPRPWDQMVKKNFARAVKAGTGVVAIHAANNAFKGWSEYEFMLGLMWRDGTGHGKFHEFDVDVLDPEHPITKGLAPFKKHPDELYHNLVNSQKTQPRLLMQAMSNKDSGGTGTVQPMAFTLQFGEGRIFATPLGHVWVGDQASKRSVLDPQFRALLARGSEWAATGRVSLPPTFADVRTHNSLSPDEQAEGWNLLFDGTSPSGLRGFKSDKFPDKGWVIKDATLVHTNQGGGGDLVTKDQFENFAFECEWKVAKGGNSGIIYRCDEDHKFPWETGREMQILDDENHNDGKKPKTRSGTMYDLFECRADVVRPFGEWNRSRITCNGTRIEHWLNGVRVVDIDTASDEYKAALAASKFPSMPDFGKPIKGHIALQDHGDEVAFRNIKVKVLK